MSEVRILDCPFCGERYYEGSTRWGETVSDDALHHVRVCTVHPMRQLEEENARLREALVLIAGADGDDLDRLRADAIADAPSEELLRPVLAVIDVLKATRNRVHPALAESPLGTREYTYEHADGDRYRGMIVAATDAQAEAAADRQVRTLVWAGSGEVFDVVSLMRCEGREWDHVTRVRG